MKVLFLTNTPSPYRIDFFNSLGKRCELTVLFETKSAKSRDSKWKYGEIRDFKAVFLKGIRVGEAEALSFDVIRYLDKKKYDIFVVGMYSSPTGMLAIEYLKRKKISFIISSDGGIKKNDTGIKFLMKKYFISSASAWLSTGVTTSDYLAYYGADTEKIHVYPFSSIKEKDILKKALSSGEKENIRAQLGMSEKNIVISVGQFIYRKGYDVLIEGATYLDNSIGIYIIGGKPTEEYLSLIDKYGIQNVHFVDFMSKEELSNYYKAADVFVLPTREDIWGLVINEALSYGLPVVTTDRCVAGIELIQNDINGYICEVESAKAIALAIKKAMGLCCDEALKTAKKYTIEAMARSHVECFNKFTE